MLQEIIDELHALGWHAVLHGPETHLFLPVVYLLIAILILFGGKRK